MGPAVSVVVATRSRVERLRALLESLALQGAGGGTNGGIEGGFEVVAGGGTNGGIEGWFEVVVVADGASSGVLEVLASPPAGLVLRVERHERSLGPAAARNTGWRAASAPLVAFTDDDCVAAPGWLAALVECHLVGATDPPGDTRRVVQGRVEPLPSERDLIGPFNRTLWVRKAGPFFQTANMLYPRSLLEELGGFDEAYPYPAGEDTDLGWRAQELGAQIAFAPDALVWHAVHEFGPAALVRDAPRWGSAVRIVKRHPGLRAAFPRRYFWKRSHERLLLAAAGLALARRTRGLSLAALVPYLLAHRGEHFSTESLVRSLPAHLAVDAAEVAVLAKGSVEQGTLLL